MDACEDREPSHMTVRKAPEQEAYFALLTLPILAAKCHQRGLNILVDLTIAVRFSTFEQQAGIASNVFGMRRTQHLQRT